MNGANAVNPRELGDRLRKARSNANITQEDAAVKLGVGRTTLVAIEKGQRKLKASELMSLCKLYNISTNRMLRPEAIHVDFSVKFRRSQVSPAKENDAVEAIEILTHLASSAVEVERILGRGSEHHYPPEQAIMSGDVDQQAEDAAMSLRHYLGVGLSPVSDIVSLIELQLDIRVFVRPLSSNISGVFAYERGIGACILLNSKHPPQRRANSAAHEIGHFMSTRNQLDVFEDNHHDNAREERFANVFGNAFLMPAITIRRIFESYKSAEGKFSPRNLILMAHSFNVTVEAMCRRLEKLRLLKSGTYASLKDKGLNGSAVKEVLGDPVQNRSLSVPPKLASIFADAYHKGLLSEGQIAEMLLLDRVEIRKLLDALNTEDFDELFEPEA